MAALAQSGFELFGENGGGAGNVIDSIQRGTIDVTGVTWSSLPVAINPVDRNRSICMIYATTNANQPNRDAISIKFTADDEIMLQRGLSPTATDIRAHWQVIQFNDVKSVQTGTVALTVSGQNVDVSINPVDKDKSILVVSYRSDSGSNVAHSLYADIIDSTTLRFATFPATVYAEWQVIEFN